VTKEHNATSDQEAMAASMEWFIDCWEADEGKPMPAKWGQADAKNNANLDRLDEFDHPFTVNEHGIWCPLCGAHIAAPHNIDETYVPPEVCAQCGFPDEIDPEAI